MNISNIKPSVEHLKKKLVNVFGTETRVIIFGSAARGDCDKESDIDILVLLACETDIRVEEKVFSLAYEIELEFDVVFGIIVYSVNFWNTGTAYVMPLYKNIAIEGIAV
jgi:predicted nucleotidyltransferase